VKQFCFQQWKHFLLKSCLLLSNALPLEVTLFWRTLYHRYRKLMLWTQNVGLGVLTLSFLLRVINFLCFSLSKMIIFLVIPTQCWP
jgi:hypothetical protein